MLSETSGMTLILGNKPGGFNNLPQGPVLVFVEQ